MKSCSTLLASVVSAQLLSALAETAEVPQVTLTKIDPKDAAGAVNRLIEHNTFQVLGAKNKKTKPKRKGGKPRKGRQLKEDKKKGGGAQGSAPRGRPPQQHSQTARTGPQSGTVAAAAKTTGRAGGPKKPAGGPPRGSNQAAPKRAPPIPASTGRHHQYEDDYWMGDDTSYYDDYFRHDDYYYGKGSYYDDYYYDDGHYYDDHYYGKGKGKGTKKGKGKGKGGKGYYYDDYYYGDDYYVGKGNGGGGGGEQTLLFEAFQDSRFLAPPVFIDSGFDEFLPGTVYLYNDAAVHHVDFVDGGSLLGIVQGTCTRTDRNDPITMSYTGQGVCQLTYEVLEGNRVVASFTAEGAVDNDFDGSTLTVTGGLGELEGVSGIVVLQAAVLDFGTNPPTVIPDGSLDFLSSSTQGYFMRAELYVDMDVSFPTVDPEIPPGTSLPTITVPPTIIPPSNFPTFSGTFGGTGGAGPLGIVMCPGLPQEDYCDCLPGSDCHHFANSRCSCAEARACCGV